MSYNKGSVFLFGAAAGVAIGAALIGLLLIGAAAVIDLRADAHSVLTNHPLFISGKDLIFSSLLAGTPLFAVWALWRKR